MSGLPTPNGHSPSQSARPPAAPPRRLLPLAAVVADQEALAAVPRAVAERLKVVPVARRVDALLVAMADTTDVHTIDELARLSRCRIAAQAAAPNDIQLAILRFYGSAA